jgi:hypothetical protein
MGRIRDEGGGRRDENENENEEIGGYTYCLFPNSN